MQCNAGNGNNVAVVTTHHDTSQVDIVISRKRFKAIPFGAFGKGTNRLHGKDDSRNIFKTMTQREHWLLWTLDQVKDPKTNIAILKRSDMSSEDTRALDQVYPQLRAKEVLMRIRQNTYLINPLILLPTFETFEDVKAHWYSLGGKDPYQ